MIVNECKGGCMMLYYGILKYMKAWMHMNPYDSI